MKKLIMIVLMFILSMGICYSETSWETNYIQNLKIVSLEDAIKIALDEEGPACEILKISLDKKYEPYPVIVGIFKNKGGFELDQLCMCATEFGVKKAIIALAAQDNLDIDEVTQSQCLMEGIEFEDIIFEQEKPFDPVSPYKP